MGRLIKPNMDLAAVCRKAFNATVLVKPIKGKITSNHWSICRI